MLGLRRTLDMPPPPKGTIATANLPHRTEIFNTLVSRFRLRSSEVDAPLESTLQERHVEATSPRRAASQPAEVATGRTRDGPWETATTPHPEPAATLAADHAWL